MRLTPAEIALVLIAVDLAVVIAVLRGRHRKPRRNTLQRTLDAWHAYEREDPPQPTGWGFHRRPRGCTEYFERGSQTLYCNAHKVDREIETWRI